MVTATVDNIVDWYMAELGELGYTRQGRKMAEMVQLPVVASRSSYPPTGGQRPGQHIHRFRSFDVADL